MQNRSREGDKSNAGFIGLRCDTATKRRVKQRAEAEGLSLSEYVRRQLDQATEKQAE